MKRINGIIVFAFLALLLFNVLASGVHVQVAKADELTLSGVTHSIEASNQPSNGSAPDDWSMFHHDLNRTGTSTSAASNGNLLWKLTQAIKSFHLRYC
jgi:hypothetical protein